MYSGVNGTVRLETNAFGLDDGRAKPFWNDAGTRRIFSKCGNHYIICENTVLLKALKVRLGYVRPGINENAVTDVLEPDDARPAFSVMIGFQIRCEWTVSDRIAVGVS